MKTYIGTRDGNGTAVVYVQDSIHGSREIAWRLDLRNHSPTGLEWGYGGSGPAQCALALLADVLENDARALKFYQRFKWHTICGFDRRGFAITDDQIRDILIEIDDQIRDIVEQL